MDLALFLGIYYSLSIIYRFLMDDNSKRIFESIVSYCKSYTTLIPLSFLLGFFVNLIMQRWWDQYMTIPWPDTLAVFVSVHVHGQDERGRVMRRTVMRYACLCQTLVFTYISPRVKKRFPTLDYFVEAGILLENEKLILQDMINAFPKTPMHWMPIVWAASIVTRARREGRIRDDLAVKTIIDELNKFRGGCGFLLFYDFINVPLVYTQVVTLAVYMYFLCTVFGQQWTDVKTDTQQSSTIVDYYFPVFSTIQFVGYMGWLKVAETLINPWGDDDDDFEVNWMIDRNLQMSFLIVDEMHHEHPDLVKDQYWDEVFPPELPLGADHSYMKNEPPTTSTAKLDITKNPSRPIVSKVSLSSIYDDENAFMKMKNKSLHYMDRSGESSQLKKLEKDSKDIHEMQHEKPEKEEQIEEMDEYFDTEENDLEEYTRTYYDDSDNFETLKNERERNRLERQLQNYLRALEAVSLEPEIPSVRFDEDTLMKQTNDLTSDTSLESVSIDSSELGYNFNK